MHLLASWVMLAFGLWIISALVPGFSVKGFQGALIGGAVFAVLHFFLGWVLFVMIGIGTLFLGFIFAFITRWIVTAIVLKIAGAISQNIEVDSFRTALIASALLSVLSAIRDVLMP
jgi:putative membrane protein